MRSGEKSSGIHVNVINNEIPELTKIFQVMLKNPTGGGNFVINILGIFLLQ